MLLALYTVRTVNLKEIADGFSGRADKESRYRRLKRFFAEFDFDFTLWLNLFLSGFSLFVGVYLVLDRTNCSGEKVPSIF